MQEIFSDFGKDLDKDVMCMERRPITQQIINNILRATDKKQNWRLKNSTKQLVIEKTVENQDLL